MAESFPRAELPLRSTANGDSIPAAECLSERRTKLGRLRRVQGHCFDSTPKESESFRNKLGCRDFAYKLQGSLETQASWCRNHGQRRLRPLSAELIQARVRESSTARTTSREGLRAKAEGGFGWLPPGQLKSQVAVAADLRGPGALSWCSHSWS